MDTKCTHQQDQRGIPAGNSCVCVCVCAVGTGKNAQTHNHTHASIPMPTESSPFPYVLPVYLPENIAHHWNKDWKWKHRFKRIHFHLYVISFTRCLLCITLKIFKWWHIKFYLFYYTISVISVPVRTSGTRSHERMTLFSLLYFCLVPFGFISVAFINPWNMNIWWQFKKTILNMNNIRLGMISFPGFHFRPNKPQYNIMQKCKFRRIYVSFTRHNDTTLLFSASQPFQWIPLQRISQTFNTLHGNRRIISVFHSPLFEHTHKRTPGFFDSDSVFSHDLYLSCI